MPPLDRESRPAAGLPRLLPPALVAPLAVLAASACAPGAEKPEAAATWLRESAAERGLDFRHVRGNEQRYWFPEIMGSGVALLDLEGDGDLDVYCVQSGDLAEALEGRNAEGNRVYRNVGAGSFEDATATVGGGDRGYGMGCAAGDFDGDGTTDLYVTNVGPNVLLRNDSGQLADVTDTAGVGHDGWGTSTTFLDHDGDGDLDLFVVNYLRWSPQVEKPCLSEHGEEDYCSPKSYNAPAPDVLFENTGDGRFRDVTREAGLGSSFGNGLGVVAADLNGDAQVDIYVANDMMANQLWQNRGGGQFENVALLAGCAANMDGAVEAGMGTVAVDVENDGDLDLFLTHLRDETNTFYRNVNGFFTDRTANVGLAAPSRAYTGFGVGFADFDHDGVLDLVVGNGAVTRNRPLFEPSDPYAEPNQLFRGRPHGERNVQFDELPGAIEAGPKSIRATRGLAIGDLDGDGDQDVLLIDSTNEAVLLVNERADAHPDRHWIRLRLVQPWGSDALGASARVTSTGSPAGDQWRTVLPGTSYCSSNEPTLHYGLGSSVAPVSVQVRWTDGTTESFGPLDVDRTHSLVRGRGRPGDG